MRAHFRAAAAITLIVVCAAVYSAAQDVPVVQPQIEQPPNDAGKPPSGPTREPTVTVFDHHEVQGILGKEVRSAADEDMGRIVDVIVDRSGQVRAAVIDFGGFLGVGSRKIVVDWNALHFGRVNDKSDNITLELTKAQVSAAPEYQEDKPIVVLGAAGNLSPFDEEH